MTCDCFNRVFYCSLNYISDYIQLVLLGRQYREAGQISQQVKTLTKQLEEEQEQMSLLETQLSSHTTQLLSLNQQVASMEAKIVSLRKEKGNRFVY